MTWKQCVCGWSAAADLDTCGHYLCELHARGLGELELVREDGGWRHYLHGEAVHCGQGLLLAAHTEGQDPWPIGSTPATRGAVAHVRYEAPLAQEKPPPALLYTEVMGHEAVITCRGYMRVRWPHRSRS